MKTNTNAKFLNSLRKWLNIDYDNKNTLKEQSNKNLWDKFITQTEGIIWVNKKKSDVFKIKVKNILSLLNSIEIKLNTINNADNTSKKEILQESLILLKEVETEICINDNYAYYTLPYSAQFIYVAADVFKLCKDNNVFNKNSPEIIHYSRTIQTYMENVMITAFKERFSYIHLNQVKNSSIVYIYDGLTNQELTYRVALQQKIINELNEVEYILRNKIAEDYIQQLPIDIIQKSLNLIFETQEFKTWSKYKGESIYSNSDNLNIAENNTKMGLINNVLIYNLIIPDIKNKYFSDIKFNLIDLPTIENNNKTLITPNIDWKPIAKAALSATINKIIEEGVEITLIGTLSAAGLACLAPLAAIIFDQLFPSAQPITREEMIEEIEKRVQKALTDYQITILKAKFATATDAYLLRMETIANNNKDIKDKSTWDLGKPQDWEASIDTLNDLKNYFFIDGYEFQYQTSQLFSTFASMYLTLLYGRLQTVKKGDVASIEQTMLKSFFTGWYIYMQKLADQSWNKTVDNSDFYREYSLIDPEIFLHEYRIYNHYNGMPISNYYMVAEYNSLYNVMEIFDIRYRLYATLSTSLYDLCKAYDVAVAEYNKAFNDTLPSLSAESIFKNKVENKYYKTMSQLYDRISKDSNLDNNSCSLFYDYGKEGLLRNNLPHFSNLDLYVAAYRGDYIIVQKYFTTGNYVFNDDDIKQIKAMQIPRGYFVRLFENRDFSGNYLDLPIYNDRNENSTFCISNYSSTTFKSIQIRFKFDFWFKNQHTQDYLRLKNISTNKDTTLANNIIIDWPLNPYIDPNK